MFKIVAFLGSEGYPLRDLWDYEDGATLGQLLALNVEAGRLALTREKTQVTAMTTSLASLFDSKLIPEFHRKVDAILEATDFLSDRSKPKGTVRVGSKTFQSKQEAAIHSVRELNKLNVLLSKG